jgi:hypothetical protein
MPGIGIGQLTGLRVEKSEKQRHEHAVVIVLIELAIDRLGDPRSGHLCRIHSLPEIARRAAAVVPAVPLNQKHLRLALERWHN